MPLRALDARLAAATPRDDLTGLRRAAAELWVFGLKSLRACLFAGLFFTAVFAVPRGGVLGLPRYDVLLLVALLIQACMLRAGLESWDELKAITLFHAIGFALEAFKTSEGIRAWSYQDFAYTKVLGVPLFSGFMYAAVGSYIIQAWRLFDIRVRHHPPFWMATVIALAIYANFFTHHYVADLRWYLAACALGLYARTSVTFRPLDRDRTMPLLASFLLIGFFVWLAENLSTFFRVWSYPDQLGAWTAVHVGKWSSWSLLVVMTFTIVAHLKHIKQRIHVPA
ncbi:MAG: DUF817 domain-containing protein [Gemmatimonadaceae bacterium]